MDRQGKQGLSAVLSRLRKVLRCIRKYCECPNPTLDSHDPRNKEEIYRLVRSLEDFHNSRLH